MLSDDKLENLALRMAQGKDIDVVEHLASFEWYGKMYSKGRPRFSGNGHAFTPPNTRAYEQKLKKYFIEKSEGIIHCPVAVRLNIFDPIPKSMSKTDQLLARNDLVYSSRGDIDNRAKAIFDAGNGVIYNDDSQIVQTVITREYGEKEGFVLSIQRMGLSPSEQYNINNYFRRLSKETLWSL